jgi:hypothetical protein
MIEAVIPQMAHRRHSGGLSECPLSFTELRQINPK